MYPLVLKNTKQCKGVAAVVSGDMNGEVYNGCRYSKEWSNTMVVLS